MIRCENIQIGSLPRNMANETDHTTVDALVDSVTSKYSLVQRYYQLKADLLGLNEMFDYDRYAPMIDNEATISWDEARKMVLDSYLNSILKWEKYPMNSSKKIG